MFQTILHWIIQDTFAFVFTIHHYRAIHLCIHIKTQWINKQRGRAISTIHSLFNLDALDLIKLLFNFFFFLPSSSFSPSPSFQMSYWSILLLFTATGRLNATTTAFSRYLLTPLRNYFLLFIQFHNLDSVSELFYFPFCGKSLSPLTPKPLHLQRVGTQFKTTIHQKVYTNIMTLSG